MKYKKIASTIMLWIMLFHTIFAAYAAFESQDTDSSDIHDTLYWDLRDEAIDLANGYYAIGTFDLGEDASSVCEANGFKGVYWGESSVKDVSMRGGLTINIPQDGMLTVTGQAMPDGQQLGGNYDSRIYIDPEMVTFGAIRGDTIKANQIGSFSREVTKGTYYVYMSNRGGYIQTLTFKAKTEPIEVPEETFIPTSTPKPNPIERENYFENGVIEFEGIVEAGNEVTLKAVPAEGYDIGKVDVFGETIFATGTQNNTYTFTVPPEGMTLNDLDAYFDPILPEKSIFAYWDKGNGVKSEMVFDGIVNSKNVSNYADVTYATDDDVILDAGEGNVFHISQIIGYSKLGADDKANYRVHATNDYSKITDSSNVIFTSTPGKSGAKTVLREVFKGNEEIGYRYLRIKYHKARVSMSEIKIFADVKTTDGEEPAPEADVVLKNIKLDKNNKLNVELNYNNGAASAAVVVASYNTNGSMYDLAVADVGSDAVVAFGEDGYIVDDEKTIKLFAWDNIESMKPLSKTYTKEDIKPYNPLSDKIVYAFGDSIVKGHNAPDKSFMSLISKENDMTLDMRAVNGATIMKSSNHILTQVNHASSTKPDIIVFNGYTNDAYDSVVDKYGERKGSTADTFDNTTFCGGFEEIIYTMKQKWPNTPIVFVTIHKSSARDWSIQCKLRELSMEICKEWGVEVVDVFHDAALDTRDPEQLKKYIIGGAGSHPNEIGCREFYMPLVMKKLQELL